MNSTSQVWQISLPVYYDERLFYRYWGIYRLFFFAWCNSGWKRSQVFSFEPEEKNYRYLHENMVLNNFSNIKIFNTALGLETKTAKIFINSDNDAGHALWNVGCHPDYLKSRLHCITRDVQVASLDSLLQGVHVPNIRLIHIDTCGAELDIIQVLCAP